MLEFLLLLPYVTIDSKKWKKNSFIVFVENS